MDVSAIKNKIREHKLQIKELEKQLENCVDTLIKGVPEKVKIHIKVDKVIDYDTSEFTDFLYDYIQTNREYDINIKEELLDYLNDNLCLDYYLDYEDYDFTVEEEC